MLPDHFALILLSRNKRNYIKSILVDTIDNESGYLSSKVQQLTWRLYKLASGDEASKMDGISLDLSLVAGIVKKFSACC